MKPIKISDEIKQALDSNQPIVALESTLITHGLQQSACSAARFRLG